MIVGVIAERSLIDVLGIVESHQYHVDAFEWRLDYLAKLNFFEMKRVLELSAAPIIMTLRGRAHGGLFTDENRRMGWLLDIAALRPAFMDIECDMPTGFIQRIRAISPSTRLIRSYLNLECTPPDLHGLLQSLQENIHDYLRIVTFANNAIDSLRLLSLIKKFGSEFALIGHCLGRNGEASRVLSYAVGSQCCYVNLSSSAIVPGMLSWKTAQEIYQVARLNRSTQWFALIGEPVEGNSSHELYNREFIADKKNAVYVKLSMSEEELPAFVMYAKTLPFCGVSVSMPLTEAIINYIDELSPEIRHIGSANTLRVGANCMSAVNTDGVGSVNAMGKIMRLSRKNVLLFGACGTAKAIAHALKAQGANVIVVNQSLGNAQALAKTVGGQCLSLDELGLLANHSVDAIINTIPRLSEKCKLLDYLLRSVLFPEAVVFDVTYGTMRDGLLAKAKQNGYRCLDFLTLHQEQAKLEKAFWQ